MDVIFLFTDGQPTIKQWTTKRFNPRLRPIAGNPTQHIAVVHAPGAQRDRPQIHRFERQHPRALRTKAPRTRREPRLWGDVRHPHRQTIGQRKHSFRPRRRRADHHAITLCRFERPAHGERRTLAGFVDGEGNWRFNAQNLTQIRYRQRTIKCQM